MTALTLVRAKNGYGFHWLINQTDSSEREMDVPGKGRKSEPLGEIMGTPHGGYFNLKGQDVGIMAGHSLNFLINRAWKFVESGLHHIGHTDHEKIDWYVFHQANQGLIWKVTDALGIPREKILWTLSIYLFLSLMNECSTS